MINYAITHNGMFHADDVFSAALLKIRFPRIEIKRVARVPEGYCGLAFDIGGKEYDHHQKNSEIRSNGIPYASFGLLWRKYGKELIAESEVKRFDERFIQPIDHADNMGPNNLLSEVIMARNPVWNSRKNIDEAFFETVELAKEILETEFLLIKAEQEAEKEVLSRYEMSDGKVVILEDLIPWKKTLQTTNALFVVFPSERGGYCVQSVPKYKEGHECKVLFPEEWAGESEEILNTIITGLRFCHPKRFIIRVDDLIAVRKVLNYLDSHSSE